MLVNLSDVLTSEGSCEQRDVDLEMTCFDGPTGSCRILEKTLVSFTFTNAGSGKAVAQGSVSVKLMAACDRCLTEVPVAMDLVFERQIVSPDAEADEEELDDLDFMEGYYLNADTLVRDEILGGWPAKILCKEDCKGICPKCGQDLNKGDCGCDTFVPDPRMAAIQDIFNAGKEV